MTARRRARPRRVTLDACAKLNLGLAVGPPRADGYHDLITVFQSVSLADTLTATRTTRGFALTVRHEDVALRGGDARRDRGRVPVGRDNLVLRAARLVHERFALPGGVRFTLVKRIPTQAGMGGGSSDAASTLMALNRLWDLKLSRQELQGIGLTLGADVPFLLLTHATAVGTGTGAELTPLVAPPSRAVVLELPGFAVSSKDAFGWFAQDRGERPYTAKPAPLPVSASWDEIRGAAQNDLEPPVFRRHPSLEERRAALAQAGAAIARMTGSGSTVFGVFDSPDEAARAVQAAPTSRFLTKTVEHVAPIEVIA